MKKVLKDGTADIGEKYLKAIAECASDYTDKIMRKIREYGYNEELAKLHFLGGGAMLMKHFAKLDQSKVRFIASGADRGMFYGEETGNQKYQACILPV